MSRINYNLSHIRAIIFDVDGVLSPSVMPLDSDGRPQRLVNVKDAYAIRLALKKGLRIAIISGGEDKHLHTALTRLGISDIIMGCADKESALLSFLETYGLTPGEAAMAGDDIPDIPAMKIAGLSIAPADASHDVRDFATYISRINGGCGVAREIIEEILRAKNLWLNEKDDYLW